MKATARIRAFQGKELRTVNDTGMAPEAPFTGITDGNLTSAKTHESQKGTRAQIKITVSGLEMLLHQR